MTFPTQLQSFFEKQYSYFINNGYTPYYEAKTIGNSLYVTDLYILHNKEFFNAYNLRDRPELKIYEFSSTQEYIKFLNKPYNNCFKKWHIKPKDENNPSWEAIKYIYANNPEERKTILTYFNGLSDVPLNDCFEEFFDLNCTTKKDLVLFIKSFPKTSLGINTINLNKLDNYLINKGFSFEEIDKFFFNYFKNRESKLNLPGNFPEARDFLLQKYDGQYALLEKYFDFFPALQNEFSEKSLSPNDIFLPIPTLSTITDIDLNQCMKKILTDKWEVVQYRRAVGDIRRAIAEYYNVEHHYSQEPIGTKNIERLIFMHNNENLTQKVVTEIVLDYLLYLKNDPDMKVDSKTNYAWLSHNLLTKKINDIDMENKITTHKKKI